MLYSVFTVRNSLLWDPMNKKKTPLLKNSLPLSHGYVFLCSLCSFLSYWDNICAVSSSPDLLYSA